MENQIGSVEKQNVMIRNLSDRLEVENARYHRERNSWNELANKHAKRQHQLEAKFKAVNDVIKKLSGEDVVYVKWIRNALKGVVLGDKTTTPRVEVDEKGTVVYCEYADDCPSAIEASKPKKKKKS
jgi:hypothetical protein